MSKLTLGYGSHLIKWWVKARKKEPKSVWTILKTNFWIFEKSSWEHYISKFNYYYLVCFYILKVETTKFSWKFTMFQELFYMFKALRKTCGQVVFLHQKSFSLIKCSPNVFNFFLWILIYSTRMDPCVQNIQKIKIHIPF